MFYGLWFRVGGFCRRRSKDEVVAGRNASLQVVTVSYILITGCGHRHGKDEVEQTMNNTEEPKKVLPIINL